MHRGRAESVSQPLERIRIDRQPAQNTAGATTPRDSSILAAGVEQILARLTALEMILASQRGPEDVVGIRVTTSGARGRQEQVQDEMALAHEVYAFIKQRIPATAES